MLVAYAAPLTQEQLLAVCDAHARHRVYAACAGLKDALHWAGATGLQ